MKTKKHEDFKCPYCRIIIYYTGRLYFPLSEEAKENVKKGLAITISKACEEDALSDNFTCPKCHKEYSESDLILGKKF